MKIKLLLTSAMLIFVNAAFADSTAKAVGKTVSEFGAGVGESISGGIARGVAPMQPEWITVSPRPKAECLEESAGELNATYMRCRNGRQEFVRFDANGNKRVLNERSIPTR